MTNETKFPLTSSYMSDIQIQNMAEVAIVSYEFTASWAVAYTAALEFAADEWHTKATPSQVMAAVSLAKTGWEGIRSSVKTSLMGANQ